MGHQEEGLQFLEQNAKTAGVEVTESGLQYSILHLSESSKKPEILDSVEVKYEGRFIDGTVFDATQGAETASFPVYGVIKGWREGLRLMPLGSRFRFFVPAELAYGEEGAGQAIPPHAVLIFDVELVGIEGYEGN